MLSEPGLYVHFPWCVKKCPYCDFNSHPIKGPIPQSGYAAALREDLKAQLDALHSVSFASVFVGGGTPSLFSPRLLADVLALAPLGPSAEVTIEANPGTQEYVDFADYLDAGVNRLSLGAQSFVDVHLKSLGRIHSSHDTTVAYDKARTAGFENINLDLMWGLPGQTVGDALSDIERAVALQPEHISWYQLTIEPRTEFAIRTPLLPVEDVLAEIERAGFAMLAASGYARYEVSAYARPGAQSRHNVNYWKFGDYLGIGAGAHGKVTEETIQRTVKASQPRLYLQDPTCVEVRDLQPDELPIEFMMNALRLIDGVDWSEFSARTGLRKTVVESQWEQLAVDGLVKADRCATTPKGLRYLDSVLGRFV